MGDKIRITWGDVSLEAELNESNTAERILDALPITGRISRWGAEVYFTIPVRLEPENPQDVVESGDLGYWPPGSAFCVFWGQTPASVGSEIRPASPVNVFGRVNGDASLLEGAAEGEEIRIERN